MRWLCVIVALLLGAAADARTVRPGLTGNSVGPISFGMSAADIEALGLPFERDTLLLEDEPYPRIVVEFERGGTIEALFFGGRLADLTTRAGRLATARGARVGQTLDELRSRYPEGVVNIGEADGRYFKFETPEFGFFDFETGGVPATCFDYNGACPDLGDRRSISYRIRDLSR